jgi:hypothetical protein
VLLWVVVASGWTVNRYRCDGIGGKDAFHCGLWSLPYVEWSV